MLWDTSSQVSLISKKWLDKYLCNSKLEDLSSVLGCPLPLDLESVNGTRIPYVGYALLDFSIGSAKLKVPFLVTKDDLSLPIIGYNVIQSVVKDENSIDVNVANLCKGFVDLSTQNAESLVGCLQITESLPISRVCTFKQGTVIRAGSNISIPVKVKDVVVSKRTPVLFQPDPLDILGDGVQVHESLLTLKRGSKRIFVTVSNSNCSDVKLDGKMCLGELHFSFLYCSS